MKDNDTILNNWVATILLDLNLEDSIVWSSEELNQALLEMIQKPQLTDESVEMFIENVGDFLNLSEQLVVYTSETLNQEWRRIYQLYEEPQLGIQFSFPQKSSLSKVS
ncbi:MAG: hypothetical protein ABFD08_02880 [Syntrophomonas sp.]